jgi:hypothetical protein
MCVTTTTRAETLPDIPILSDFLPGYEASFWDGFGVATHWRHWPRQPACNQWCR